MNGLGGESYKQNVRNCLDCYDWHIDGNWSWLKYSFRYPLKIGKIGQLSEWCMYECCQVDLVFFSASSSTSHPDQFLFFWSGLKRQSQWEKVALFYVRTRSTLGSIWDRSSYRYSYIWWSSPLHACMHMHYQTDRSFSVVVLRYINTWACLRQIVCTWLLFPTNLPLV